MKEEILELLKEEIPEVDFTSSDALVDDGILDSLSLVTIISSLTARYGIEIPYEEIDAENFNSIEAMAAMVTRILGADDED